MEIKDLIKARRLELGMTMLDISKLVRVSEATISRWESGDIANMKRDKIVLLANALRVSPSVIMGWEESPSTQLVDEQKNTHLSGNMFSNKLKEIRKLKGLSMDELCDAYNKKFNGKMNKSTLSRYENNLQEPMLTVARNLAEILNVDANFLFQDEVKDCGNEKDGIEQEHIKKYRTLDEKGKHTVDTVLTMEYDRCKNNKIRPLEKQTEELLIVARNGDTQTRIIDNDIIDDELEKLSKIKPTRGI